jgi:hypothetical protein
MVSTVISRRTLPRIEDSQTLWHVAAGVAPPVTAVLTRLPAGDYDLEVTFGTITRQCRRFASSLAAVEHADRLFARLEERGYRRQRLDRRT